MKVLQVFQASYACLLCLLHLELSMVVSGKEELISPLVAQSTLVRHDKKLLPSSTSITTLGPDQVRELQPVVADTWEQIGANINGESGGDESGWSLAMSDDGTRVAIGSQWNEMGNGYRRGHVRVYNYDSDSSSWVQLGNDINGEADSDQSGYSVAMSDDGSRVAIGAYYNSNGNGERSGHVRVYDYDPSNDIWVKVGNDIDGEAKDDHFGSGVAMRDDGTRVAIGAQGNDAINGHDNGHVRVYDYEPSSNTWVQIGNDIDGEGGDDRSGSVIAMSKDGVRVAIASSRNNGSKGHVRVFDYDDSNNSWVQIGTDIHGSGVDGNNFGASVAMSADGIIVAIGATQGPGEVRVYLYDESNNSWGQIGNVIYGEPAPAAGFGHHVAMSDDGTRVAVGAPFGTDLGLVRMYDYESSSESWVQVGNDLEGEFNGGDRDHFGHRVAMSGNGMIVSVSARMNDGNGDRSGNVRVFSDESATPSPTGSPTASPTGSPTIQPANLRSFEIHSTGKVTGTPITDISIELLAPFNASNREHETIVLSSNCIDEFTGTAADAFNVTDTPDESLGNGFISYVSKILVDTSKMNNTGYWRDLPGGALGGVFDMCLESAVFFMLPGTKEKMNFVNTNLTVTVEMDANFNITAINAERKDVREEELTLDYSNFVTAYQCEKDSEDVQLTGQQYSQGDVLKICVKSSDSDIVQVERIKSLTLSQAGPGAGDSHSYITDGEPTSVEIASTACDKSITPAHVCYADMQLLGRYFSVEEPGDLTATGSVELTFSTGRRLTVDVPVTGIRGGQGDLPLEKNSARRMEKTPEDSRFDVKVSLKSVEGSGGTNDFYGATLLLSGMAAAAGGAILMV